MNKKVLQIVIEIAWIVIAVFCFAVGIFYNLKFGAKNVWLIYVIGVICICMFFLRRMQRKNNERRNNRFRIRK